MEIKQFSPQQYSKSNVISILRRCFETMMASFDFYCKHNEILNF